MLNEKSIEQEINKTLNVFYKREVNVSYDSFGKIWQKLENRKKNTEKIASRVTPYIKYALSVIIILINIILFYSIFTNTEENYEEYRLEFRERIKKDFYLSPESYNSYRKNN